jgi:hypothetical protein
LFRGELDWLRFFFDGDCQYLIILILWHYRYVLKDPWKRLKLK